MKRYSMLLHRKRQYCENGYTSKWNLQMQRNPHQITNGIFHRTRVNNLQFIWKHKDAQQPEQSWERLELEEWSSLDFRLCCRTAVWCWHGDRNTDQCHRVESPEINPCTYRYLIFYKGGKNIKWGQRQPLQ